VHLAVCFPGGSIPGQDPFDDRLDWVTIRALEQAGAFVVPVRYDDDVLGPDRARFEDGVRRELRGALAHHEPTRLTLVGKSRGTNAVQIACTEEFAFPGDTRMTWLTPLWRSERVWRAASANTLESLHVVGLADGSARDPPVGQVVEPRLVGLAVLDPGQLVGHAELAPAHACVAVVGQRRVGAARPDPQLLLRPSVGLALSSICRCTDRSHSMAPIVELPVSSVVLISVETTGSSVLGRIAVLLVGWSST
jgi:hypothetical protein